MSELPEIHLGNSVLRAVPSVHYRAVFAEQVNFACADERTRPDAIAVELGASAVAAICTWLKQLGVKPGSDFVLPCMLGLIRANRHIHPNRRLAALRLQEATGRQLHELDPLLLRRELDFSPISLLCLSSTDSIFEAIRCAIELDVPVYGVDLEEFAQGERSPIVIQDPIDAQRDFGAYLRRNSSLSEACRDTLIDGRRELAMAAHLKHVLSRPEHNNVLFVGGLAHWRQLQQLLGDSAVAPANTLPPDESRYQPVLVHPILAMYQMDIFPAVTYWYNKRRGAVPRSNPTRAQIDFWDFVRTHLEVVYRGYFEGKVTGHQLDRTLEDYQGLENFEHYLANLCLVRQRLIPDFFTALTAANAMMSERFCSELASVFMNYELGWASPKAFPQLPIIGPATMNATEEPWLQPGQKAQLIHTSQAGAADEQVAGDEQYTRTPPFYLGCLPEPSGDVIRVPIPWNWEQEPPTLTPPPRMSKWNVWPPYDNLLFAVAYQAAEVASNSRQGYHIDAFESSLLDGVDIKATMRSVTRGETRLYVREKILQTVMASQNVTNPDPTVFVFASPQDSESGHWGCLYAGWHEIGNHVKDLDRFEEIVREQGAAFISAVKYYEPLELEERLRGYVQSSDLMKGIVVFGSPCINRVQSARWLEGARYKCCPILPDEPDGQSRMDQLRGFYEEKYKIVIDLQNWSASLIQFAIPYAKQRVIVVAPDFYTPPPIVAYDARRFGREIVVLPMSYFSASDIRILRRQYTVGCLDRDGFTYPSELESLMGESKDTYLPRLPQEVRDQLIMET
ncbi:MAG: hypothetical protein BWY76_00706 [bacterium ADurb.Bin429]|nr:MAG: hypothetical protein BWY76_00706 [bacterium ADurb.Bin429]